MASEGTIQGVGTGEPSLNIVLILHCLSENRSDFLVDYDFVIVPVQPISRKQRERLPRLRRGRYAVKNPSAFATVSEVPAPPY